MLSLHQLFVIVCTHELHNTCTYNHIYTDTCMSVAISTLTIRHSFYFWKRRLGTLSCYKEPTFCSTGETAAGLGWETSGPQLQVQLLLIETQFLLLKQKSSPLQLCNSGDKNNKTWTANHLLALQLLHLHSKLEVRCGYWQPRWMLTLACYVPSRGAQILRAAPRASQNSQDMVELKGDKRFFLPVYHSSAWHWSKLEEKFP